MSSDLLKETTMKSHSTASILAAVAVASLSSLALLAPIHQAMAKGGNARAAMTQTKVSTGVQNGAAGKVYCVGSGCPGAKANAVKATTTGTYKAKCQPGSGGMCRK
jgi:hypothetical protein